jgi:hypothetical protein
MFENNDGVARAVGPADLMRKLFGVGLNAWPTDEYVGLCGA